jgi:hypothetical protein
VGPAAAGPAGGVPGEELGDVFWGAADYCGYLRATYEARSGRCVRERESG